VHDWPACNHRAHKKSGQILGEEIIAWIESECRELIERYGIDGKLFDCSDEITADCPRKQAQNLNDQCGARCPDLSKVL
jgi:hypothetical protein